MNSKRAGPHALPRVRPPEPQDGAFDYRSANGNRWALFEKATDTFMCGASLDNVISLQPEFEKAPDTFMRGVSLEFLKEILEKGEEYGRANGYQFAARAEA